VSTGAHPPPDKRASTGPLMPSNGRASTGADCATTAGPDTATHSTAESDGPVTTGTGPPARGPRQKVKDDLEWAECVWDTELKGRHANLNGATADGFSGTAMVLTEEPLAGVCALEIQILATTTCMRTGAIGVCAAGLDRVPDTVGELNVPFVMVGFDLPKWTYQTRRGCLEEISIDKKAWRPCSQFATGDRVRLEMQQDGVCRLSHFSADRVLKGSSEIVISDLPDVQWHGIVQLTGTLKAVRGFAPAGNDACRGA